jgi:hypothetical protein
MWRNTMLAVLILAAAACGSGASPTAPSSTATTNPPAAPATVNVSGTWLQSGEPKMTLTQQGATIDGMTATATVEYNGFNGTVAGTITGTVSGDIVSLTILNTVMARSPGRTMVCRGADSFSGQVLGNILSGNLISSTTPYSCEGGMPLPAPQISAPMIFTHQ